MSDFLLHATVATVVVDTPKPLEAEKYLLVEERVDGQLMYNQPAGHLEPNESLQQAALRETLEETGWEVTLTAVLGVSLYQAPSNGATFLRTCFLARPFRWTNQPQDEGIERVVWLTFEQMQACATRMRSPMVIASVKQYLNGCRYPLNLIY